MILEDGKYVISQKGLMKLMATTINESNIGTTEETAVGDTDEITDTEPSAKPHKPYEGDKPYIFASYSHKNYDDVIQIVNFLQDKGYRVWYDEGIDPGTEWADFIARRISDCSFFISFISEEYINSENCKDELEYSREEEKNRVLIYLNDIELSGGMAMRHGRIQAIHRYKYASMDLFGEKVMSAEGLDICKD